MQRAHVILLSLLAAALAVVVAWLVLAPPFAPEDQPVMPDAIGADLDAVGTALTEAGYRVVVRRPAIVVPHESEQAAKPYLIPESEQPFAPGEWTHLIGGQVPAPGEVMNRESEIVLTAGVHHGAGPWRPWLETHAVTVRERGDERCPACHAERFCGDCHAAVGVQDVNR